MPKTTGHDSDSTLLRTRPLLVALVMVIGVSDVFSDFPDKPVRVVVPFSPGGGSDTFVRVVQSVIQSNRLLPQPLVVINVPGAGGTIGSRRVKDAVGDGYTILNLHDGILSARLAEQTDYGPEAFIPLAATGRTSSMLCVREDSEWKTLSDLLEFAREYPEELKFGANLGALSHFDALRVQKAAPGVLFRFVPTGGGSKRFGDLIGQHIDATVFNVAEYDQFRSGGVRALTIFSAERHPDFADVPTAVECGVNVVRDSMQYWWAPRDTPQVVVDRLVAMLRDAMATDELKAKLGELKMEPVILTGRDLSSFLARQEIAMSTVGVSAPIRLPNTPALVITAVILLCSAVIWQRIRAVDVGQVAVPLRQRQATDTSPSALLSSWRAVATFLLLVLFCLAFALEAAPFWFLASGFVVLCGSLLLEWNRRNLVSLVLTALFVGPGAFLLFTKVLTIDLS